MDFNELGLSPTVLRAVQDVGYKEPTPIQREAIPVVLTGRDVLGCAQTGTGKTASFTLPMIDTLSQGRSRARMPRSLILEPTRELATQVSDNFEKYGKHTKLSMALLIGGESMDEQMRVLNRGVDVLIATPGRLLDLFDRGKVLLNDVKTLVIDEADRMLDMGFIPDVERIVGLLPPLRQTLFFSATMPPEIRRLADAFLTNPKEITVAPPASPAQTVTQGLAVVPSEDKREALRRLIHTENVKNALIFCNRKRDVDILFKSLSKHGFSVAALHGDMPQTKRTETLDAFRHDKVRLLVASDVAARGLDIAFLSHVFNFDVPINAEDYVHRIGRTGRAGREGRAFTLAAPEDGPAVAAIEKLIGRPIPRVEIEGLETMELDMSGRRRRRGRTPSRDEERNRHATERQPRGKRHRTPKQEDTMRVEGASVHAGPAIPPHRPEAPRNDGRRKAEPEDRAVVGLGDHVPAFLMRTYKVPARKVEAVES
ncbi:MAG TPA: DEAD/DEAH box helicase [Alphaproteobacteria bacterium]|nr:DEAD/DEAH box helicase [Alphaproteobacteria bacterium]